MVADPGSQSLGIAALLPTAECVQELLNMEIARVVALIRISGHGTLRIAAKCPVSRFGRCCRPFVTGPPRRANFHDYFSACVL